MGDDARTPVEEPLWKRIILAVPRGFGSLVRSVAGVGEFDPVYRRDGLCFLLIVLAVFFCASEWFRVNGIIGRVLHAFSAGVLGVIGSFVTGSNMSSNILFTDVQVNAAADLGVSSSPLLAAQTAGASAGSMISPSKIILGTTAGGVPGEEGTVLRFTLLTAAILTLVTGVICWIIL